MRKKEKEKVVAPICGKITLHNEYINTQNINNGPNLITQLKAPASEVILVEKLLTDIYVNSGLNGETRASVMPGKRSQEGK